MSRNNVEERHIAFHGRVELLNATWDLKSGYMVEFEILGILEGRANPFKQFTKRRKNKAGSIFKANIQDNQNNFVYADDLMLAAWGDSSTKGQTVKFWIPQTEGEHCFSTYAFKTASESGFTGLITLVEINDDGSIIDQEAVVRAEKAPKVKPRARLSYTAVAMGKHSEFEAFTKAWFCQTLTDKRFSEIKSVEERNKLVIYLVCGIKSRSELDSDERAAEAFHFKIRKPFSKWVNAHD